MNTPLAQVVPLFLFGIIAGGLALLFLGLAIFMGPRRPSQLKSTNYECGVEPASHPARRFHIHFYRIALLFLLFDIEAAFFYPWAVLFRDLSCKGRLQEGVCRGEATFFGFGVMLVFMAVLLLALIYVWRRKALEWE